MAIRTEVKYIPYAKSWKEQTGDIITFTQFEEVNSVSETRNDAESGEKYDDDSIMQPLLRNEEMDATYSGDDSYDGPISTNMLEDIRDRSQSHPNDNRRYARYKTCDQNKQR